VPSDSIPRQLARSTIYLHGKVITVSGYGIIDNGNSTSTEDQVNQLWEEGECITKLEGDIVVLIDAIKQGIAVAVSDGSFQDQRGAAAWTIKGSSAANRLTGEGLTPGNPQDQSAYRSELFGIWGMVASIY